MTTLLAIAFLLTAAASATGATPDPGTALPSRGVLYCQPPSFSYAVNASTAYESEIADDLPDSLVGRSVGEVTLYVTEWGHTEWVEPLGLVVRFYDGACAPPLEPTITYSLSWSELMTSLEVMTPPTIIVYSATAALPFPVTVTSGMSLGAYVVTDWTQQPYAGLTLTEPGEVYGCGESYWDYTPHGAPRWTPLSSATGIEADLAYCLAEVGTGIQEEEATSWGRIKRLYR
ncbi:MAG: hypothetical protein ABIE42_06150 [Candidatus Eisenbacteria bacterium]